MKLDAFAPHLTGRMLPGLFSSILPRVARFPGDPRATWGPHSSWYWMHATGCSGGLFRCLRNEEFWRRAPCAPVPVDALPVPSAALAPRSQLDLFAEGT